MFTGRDADRHQARDLRLSGTPATSYVRHRSAGRASGTALPRRRPLVMPDRRTDRRIRTRCLVADRSVWRDTDRRGSSGERTDAIGQLGPRRVLSGCVTPADSPQPASAAPSGTGPRQQAGGDGRRHGPAEQVALPEVAAELAQALGLARSVSMPSATTPMPRPWASAMTASTIERSALVRRAGHERAVDLDRVERQVLQVGQRRVAGPEVVEHEADAELRAAPAASGPRPRTGP